MAPQGGMSIQVTDIQTAEMMNVIYQSEVFTPSIAVTLYDAGTVLARLTADGKLVPYLTGQVDGSEIPVAVLGTDLTSDATPNDENIRAIVGGEVDLATLHAHTAPGVELTAAEQDLLRDYGITPRRTVDLSKLDNGA